MAHENSRHMDGKSRVGDGLPRCNWPSDDDELYLAYHDNSWGVPEYDDKALFAKLILDGFQAGLSWITILRKEQHFYDACYQFEPEVLAKLKDDQLDEILQNPNIVRNRLKIYALRANAQAFLKLHEEEGFAHYWWRQVGFKPIDNQIKDKADVPTKDDLSEAISKDLKKRGFKFVGPTIIYAFMEAVGLINNHHMNCICYDKVKEKVRNFHHE